MRFVRQGSDEEPFDRRFWLAQGPEARVEALWDMVLEAAKLRGKEPPGRLQKSVVRILRR